MGQRSIGGEGRGCGAGVDGVEGVAKNLVPEPGIELNGYHEPGVDMARTNPLKISQDQAKEQAQLPMSFPTQAVEYNGQTIHIAEEMNLTEMHKASGRNSNASPYQWSRREGAEFVKKMTLNGAHRPIMIRSQRGRNGGTFAHWQIGMEYARYLSPELAAVCNQIVKDFVDAKPEIAQSVTARTTQKGVARGFVRNQVLNIATGLESIYKHPMLL